MMMDSEECEDKRSQKSKPRRRSCIVAFRTSRLPFHSWWSCSCVTRKWAQGSSWIWGVGTVCLTTTCNSRFKIRSALVDSGL